MRRVLQLQILKILADAQSFGGGVSSINANPQPQHDPQNFFVSGYWVDNFSLRKSL
jgi:hypothetical protein